MANISQEQVSQNWEANFTNFSFQFKPHFKKASVETPCANLGTAGPE